MCAIMFSCYKLATSLHIFLQALCVNNVFLLQTCHIPTHFLTAFVRDNVGEIEPATAEIQVDRASQSRVYDLKGHEVLTNPDKDVSGLFVRMFVFTSDHQTFCSILFNVRHVMGALIMT